MQKGETLSYDIKNLNTLRNASSVRILKQLRRRVVRVGGVHTNNNLRVYVRGMIICYSQL